MVGKLGKTFQDKWSNVVVVGGTQRSETKGAASDRVDRKGLTEDLALEQRPE